MKSTIRNVLAVTAVLMGSAASAATVNQATGYALDTTGYGLFTYTDVSNPVPPSDAVILKENGVITAVDAIAYRPETGGFFAYADLGNRVFSVDVTSGALTQVVAASGTAAATQNNAGAPVATSTRTVGFDFNNALDAARIVSANEENLVFFPTPTRPAPTVIRAEDLFYVAGDDNAGADATIFANAYTNAVPKAQVNAMTQQQFALDAGLDVLTTLNNNTGELRTIGKLLVGGAEIDFSDIGGFDILSPASDDNLGLALLNVGGMSNLYSFALPGMDADGNTIKGNVTATLVSSFGQGFSSFAVSYNGQPAMVAPVPLPAAGLLLLGGLGGLGALRRFRRA